MKDKRRLTLVAFLAILGIALITTGVTYAVFSYNATGGTYSTVTVGALTFRYKEEQGKGQGISIKDAMPVSDNTEARNSNDYFEFTIESNTTEHIKIPYTITAKMSDNSYEGFVDYIDMYLTEIVDGVEVPTETFEYGHMVFYDLNDYNYNSNEKVIHNGFIPANYSGPAKRFRLRMWVDQNADFSSGIEAKYFCGDTDVTDEYYSGYTCSDGRNPSKSNIQSSDFNDKEFSVTVNVYAVGANETYISGVSIDGHEATPAPAGASYDLQVIFPYASAESQMVTYINGDITDIYTNITRMNEDFTSEYAFTANEENNNIQRIAKTEFSDELSNYQDGELWGTYYLKMELFNSETDELLDTIKLKVVVQKPIFNLSNFKIKNYGSLQIRYCDGKIVSHEEYSSCQDEEIWVDDPTDEENWGHYETIHHVRSMEYIPESNSKIKNLTPVTGKDWDYEIEIPYDSSSFELTYDKSGYHFTDVYGYITDSTFTQINDTIYDLSSFGIPKSGDVYIVVRGISYSFEDILKEVKIKLIRTNNSSYLSPSWYE